MKKFFGFVLILVAIISMSRYPNLGRNMLETAGAMAVFLLVAFFGYRLIKAKPN